MAKFAAPQLLKKGFAFCGANFPRVVETWNWLVNVAQNAKGDADVNPKTGKIVIDRTDVHNPVIRCKGCAPSSSAEVLPSAFQISLESTEQEAEDTLYNYLVSNCYFNAGGTARVGNDKRFAIYSYELPAFVAAEFAFDKQSLPYLYEVLYYATLEELQAAQKDAETYYVPLYHLSANDDGSVKIVDLRTAPQLQVFEGILE